jgi:hypothetical protein
LGTERSVPFFNKLLDIPDAAGWVIIDDRLAELYLPNEDPIGKRMKVWLANDAPWQTMIGRVGSIREAGIDKPAVPEYYLSANQTAMTPRIFR